MEPLVTIQDLSHAFGTGALRKEVLQAVSIDFYPGEIVIIMGPSGSGKTTLLTLAGALRSVQQGSIRVGGIELSGADHATVMAVRRRIGFIFQAHNLIASLSACENVQLALVVDPAVTAAESRERAMKCLEMVGLEGHGHKNPDEMSGGQKQRVAIARALIRHPDIIMADEPTAALDKKTGREVVELLQQLARQEGVAILLVTHDNRILDVADRIITLDDGRIEETHRGMERLNDALTALTAFFPAYAATVSPEAAAGGEPLESLQERFRQIKEPLFQQAAEFAARRMSPLLMAQARSLEKQLHGLVMCEETIARVVALFSAPPSEPMREIADAFFQPLDFLLATMAETRTEPTADGTELLLQLTEDRGQLMKSMRERYFDSGAGLGEEEKNYLFELTDLFARTVYLIHEWVESGQAWTATDKA